jgi:hypothetical protein
VNLAGYFEKLDARELHRVRVHPEHAGLLRKHPEGIGLPRQIEVTPGPGLERGFADLVEGRS